MVWCLTTTCSIFYLKQSQSQIAQEESQTTSTFFKSILNKVRLSFNILKCNTELFYIMYLWWSECCIVLMMWEFQSCIWWLTIPLIPTFSGIASNINTLVSTSLTGRYSNKGNNKYMILWYNLLKQQHTSTHFRHVLPWLYRKVV